MTKKDIVDSPKNKHSKRIKEKQKKKHLDSDSDTSDEEFNPLEEIVDKNSSLDAKDIQKLVSKIFPTKTKKEKKRQLKNIKQEKNIQVNPKIKNKKS